MVTPLASTSSLSSITGPPSTGTISAGGPSCPGDPSCPAHPGQCADQGGLVGYGDTFDAYIDPSDRGDYRLEGSWTLTPQSSLIGAFQAIASAAGAQPSVTLSFDNGDTVSSFISVAYSGLSPFGLGVEAVIPIAIIDTEESAPYNGGSFSMQLDLGGPLGAVSTCNMSLPPDMPFSTSFSSFSG